MARIYVSSTYEDLKSHRSGVLDTLQTLGHEHVAMEHYSAGPQRPLEQCLADVRRCDAYICILAWRYGFVPPNETRSITELEYEEAIKHDKPVFMFLHDGVSNWSPVFVDVGTARLGIDKLRERVLQNHTCRLFSTEDTLRLHVATALRGLSPETESFSELTPPRPPGLVRREDLLQSIAASMRIHPIVVVEGLSGAGKSSVAATFVADAVANKTYRTVLWFYVDDGTTVDELLSAIRPREADAHASLALRCRRLAQELHSRDALLVIDDYHKADTASFGRVLRAVLGTGSKARLLLLSQVRIRLDDAPASIGRVATTGLSESNAIELLASIGVHQVGRSAILQLLEKTEGLPLAIAMFAALIRDGEDTSASLLTGEADIRTRMKSWYTRICDLLDEYSRQLLCDLSLYGEPFDESLVRAVLDYRSEAEPAERLAELSRRFLVQRLGPTRWKMHEIVRFHAKERMAEGDRREAYAVLARHCARRAGTGGRRMSPDDLVWLAKAAAYYHSANDLDESARLVRTLSAPAKAHGYYELLCRVAHRQLELSPNESAWTAYDYAHCLFILGRVDEACRAIEPALRRSDITSEQRLALIRLQAECLAANGATEHGLEVLASSMDELRCADVSAGVWSHAWSVRIGLLTDLDHIVAARQDCQAYLADAMRRSDALAGAVGMTRLGILDARVGNIRDAVSAFERSVALFRGGGRRKDSLSHRRGLAWALMHLGRWLATSGDLRDAEKHLREAMAINDEIGHRSREYVELLEQLGNLGLSDALRRRIERERVRCISE